jgi:hypothetical protein
MDGLYCVLDKVAGADGGQYLNREREPVAAVQAD